eukprot:g24896.t1
MGDVAANAAAWGNAARSREDTTCACDSTQLHGSVAGITCLESGVGKCEPPPTVTVSSGSWGSGRELIWSGIAVNRADRFHVCYCDRHYASTCVAWVKVGQLRVSLTCSGTGSSAGMNFCGVRSAAMVMLRCDLANDQIDDMVPD